MNILSYYNIKVNIRTLLPLIMYKASYFFDFLINAPYFMQLKKGSFPIQEGPLDLPIYKIIICRTDKKSL